MTLARIAETCSHARCAPPSWATESSPYWTQLQLGAAARDRIFAVVILRNLVDDRLDPDLRLVVELV